MVGRTPCARRTDVGGDSYMLLAKVGNVDHIGHGRSPSSARTSCAPRVGLPRQERAIFFGSDLHFRKSRGTAAGNLKLGVTLQHHAYRLAVCLLRYLRRVGAPAVDAELAAEASAYVVLMHMHVGCGNLERLRVLCGQSGDILGGDVGEQMIAVSPLGNGAVAFQAAMSDHRSAIY